MIQKKLYLLLGLMLIAGFLRVSAQNEVKAYYTKLNSGNAWEDTFRSGEFSDIVVRLGTDEKFYFWRASSYLPRWETKTAANYVEQAPVTFSGDGTGLRWDKLCRHSHVRIIATQTDHAVIHWRYAPIFETGNNPSKPNWTGWIDEYYTIRNDYTITREIYDYNNSTKHVHELLLNANGTITIKNKSTEAFLLTQPEYDASNTFTTGPDLDFGAKYTKLGYSGVWYQGNAPHSSWNDNWQVGDHPDIVVNFDNNSTKWVFWRGTNFVGQAVSENGAWFNNEFNEHWTSDGQPLNGGAEPMSDKANRYAHCRLIENTPARVIVQMRYALVDNSYSLINTSYDEDGWGDFADFYFYIYPDGTVVSYNQLWVKMGMPDPDDAFLGYEYHETIVVNTPGRNPSDNIDSIGYVTLARYDGSSQTFNADRTRTEFAVNDEFPIQVVNLKNTDYDAFTIVEEGPKLYVMPYYEPPENPTFGQFPRWSHWPVNNREVFGYIHEDASHANHTALSHMIGWPLYEETSTFASKILLTGVKNIPRSEVIALANSWKNPPSIRNTSGVSFQKFDKKQKAYVLKSTSSAMSFKVRASANKPSNNPAFVIKNWSGEEVALSINGQTQNNGTDFKQGVKIDTDGTKTLIIWLNEKSSKAYTININAVSQTKYTLTTSADNGRVTPSSGSFVSGENVSVTATADVGYVFSGWGGDITASENPVSVAMDGNKTITANFTPVTTWNATTKVVGKGLAIPETKTYNDGEQAMLIAKPQLGWKFHGWTGDVTSAENPLKVKMDANKTVTANFSQIVLSASPIAHWKFNDRIGNVCKDETGTYNGTISGAEWATCENGSALIFDGVDDYVEVTGMSSVNALTVSMWVNVESYKNFFSSLVHANGWKQDDLHMFILDEDGLQAAINGMEPEGYGSPIDNFALKEWHMITATFDVQTKDVKFYCDGIIFMREQMTSGTAINLGDFRIGGWDGDNRTFHGMMDEVMIFDKALSETEVEALYYQYVDDAGNTSIKNCKTSVLSTNYKLNTNAFEIYPNPVIDNTLNVKLTDLRGEAKIILTDMKGHQLRTKMTSENRTTLDLSGIKEGTYILTIISDGKTESVKIHK